MPHIVLLGDSSLDNEVYVPPNQALIHHLQRLAPTGWQATLLAVDGARTGGVPSQLARLPSGATHLVVSVGGNDALGASGVLRQEARSVADVLALLADTRQAFDAAYQAMLGAVLGRQLPTTLCTIYNPNYPDPAYQRLAVEGAQVFNDVILRAAFVNGLPVIDLRQVFRDSGDYANAIEPSSQGGEKIARSIVDVVGQHDFSRRRSEVFL